MVGASSYVKLGDLTAPRSSANRIDTLLIMKKYKRPLTASVGKSYMVALIGCETSFFSKSSSCFRPPKQDPNPADCPGIFQFHTILSNLLF